MASGVHDDPSDVDSPSSNKESSGGSVVTAPGSMVTASSTPKLDVPFKAASFWSLYRYADRWDWLWMAFGFVGAIANGKLVYLHIDICCSPLLLQTVSPNSFGLPLHIYWTFHRLFAGIMMPLFTIVFGDVLNSFGLNLFDPTALAASVNHQVPRFVYLGIGAFFASFIQTFFLVYPSVRQANRMRGNYLRTVLGQDAGYFDTDGTAGCLLQGLNEDCATVQAAIGEKLSMFAFMMSTAVAGIVIGEFIHMM
jgi:ABC-type multidrug transport system fused ATPase/permease subunit